MAENRLWIPEWLQLFNYNPLIFQDKICLYATWRQRIICASDVHRIEGDGIPMKNSFSVFIPICLQYVISTQYNFSNNSYHSRDLS